MIPEAVKITTASLYRGIPFAEPPVGDLRWAEPVDKRGAWPGGFLDATRFRSFCPQYDTESKRVLGKEDCLYLNVFTPYLPGEPLSFRSVIF